MSRGAASPVHTGQYIQRGNLLTHIKSLHKGIKLPCGQCDYKTNKKCRLQRQGRLPYVLFACHSKLPALLDINVPRAGSPRDINVPRATSPGDKNVPRAASPAGHKCK